MMWMALAGNRWVQMGLLALAMGLWIGVVTVQKNHAQARLATCQEEQKALRAAIDRQNAAVAALEAETKERQARSAKAAADARRASEKAQGEADRLRSLLGSQTCAEAVKRVREGL